MPPNSRGNNKTHDNCTTSEHQVASLKLKCTNALAAEKWLQVTVHVDKADISRVPMFAGKQVVFYVHTIVAIHIFVLLGPSPLLAMKGVKSIYSI